MPILAQDKRDSSLEKLPSFNSTVEEIFDPPSHSLTGVDTIRMTAYRDPTAEEKGHIAKIGKDLAAVIAVYGLHAKAQASLADQGYISTDMVSELYPSVEALHRDAPGSSTSA